MYRTLANKLRAENLNLSPYLLLCFDGQSKTQLHNHFFFNLLTLDFFCGFFEVKSLYQETLDYPNLEGGD